MTLDEAIANYRGISNYLQRYYDPDAEVKLQITNGKCIEWFTEVAAWLTELKELRSIIDACNILAVDAFAVETLCKELKEAKRLLKLAVEGYNFIGYITKDYACPSAISCSACPMDEGKQCGIWEHADEALALIGEDGGAE